MSRQHVIQAFGTFRVKLGGCVLSALGWELCVSSTCACILQVPLELEDGDLPLNTFSPKKPFKGKVVSVEKITGPKATGETCNIVIDTNGDIPYWEGQSYGVVPPVHTCRY